jgi:hypothetical protein
LPLTKYKLDFDKWIIFTSAAVSVLSLVFLTLFQLEYLNAVKLGWDLGYFSAGERVYGPIKIVYSNSGSSALLLIGLLLLFQKRFRYGQKSFFNTVCLVLLSSGVLVSGSRALIICSVAGVLFLMKRKFLFWMLSILIFLPVFYLDELFLITNLFSSDEVSNKIKLAHLFSFYGYADLEMLMFGNGLGSQYYSSGRERLEHHTELFILDQIRYYGLFLTAVFYVALVLPMGFGARPINSYPFRIFIPFLVFSLSNPFLLNSLGMLLVLWYWNQSHYEIKEQHY